MSRNQKSKYHGQHGFTMLELLISTAVFAMVLLLCATAILQVGRMYYKGIIANRTQTAAKNITEDVSQAVQFGSVSGTDFFEQQSRNYSGVTVRSYCVGDIRYSYAPNTASLGNNAGQLPHILWKDRPGANADCVPRDITAVNPPGSVSGQELLGDAMRLVNFYIGTAGSDNVLEINLTVAYGADDDVFAENPDGGANYTSCISATIGGQFCAVSIINTYATKRL